MARIRTIKPEFWSNEKLATTPRDARLLLAALLNIAEDHGVCRGNPVYVRSQAFPYDADVTAEMVAGWIVELERVGSVRRFGFDGQAYIHIVNFLEHQRIDRPTKPTLPPPPEDSTSPRRILDEPSLPEGKGKERKGREGRESESVSPIEAPEQLLEAWNSLTKKPLAHWRDLTKARRTQAAARLAERPLSEWREVITRISKSRFCRGENDRGWVATPDWLLKPDTATKVLEGKYDDRKGNSKNARRQTSDEEFREAMKDVPTDADGYVILEEVGT